MCYRPRHIVNRTNHFVVESDDYRVAVPCGCCEECQDALSADWFVRCYYEYQRSGSTHFYTLTYNKEHLPHFLGRPCFSGRDITLFEKRMRKAFRALGIEIRFFVTCEYGEEFRRPHYHVLFFLSCDFDQYQMYKIVERCWSEVVGRGKSQKLISRGFVYWSRVNKGKVIDSSGIQYVCKYVSKDMSYMSSYAPLFRRYCFVKAARLWREREQTDGWPHVDMEYSREMHRFMFRVHPFDVESKVYKEEYADVDPLGCLDRKQRLMMAIDFFSSFRRRAMNEMADKIPFHRQSLGLGVNCLDVVTDEMELLGKLPVLTKKGSVLFPMPRYVRRKLWYDVLPNDKDGKMTRFVLNDRGKDMKVKKYARELDKKVSEFDAYRRANLNVAHLKAVNALNLFYFSKVADLEFFLRENPRSSFDYVVFRDCYRGRVDPDFIVHEETGLFTDSYIKFFGGQAYKERFELCGNDIGNVVFDMERRRALEPFLYEKHVYFKPYELFMRVMDAVISVSKEQEVKERVKKEYERRAMRQRVLLFN